MRINSRLHSWWLYCIVGIFAFAVTAQAASFDCAKASTKVEHMICDNPEISKLDDELAESYKSALQDKSKVAAVRVAQRIWLRERNACSNVACVKGAYEDRSASLQVDTRASNPALSGVRKGKYELDPNPRNYTGREDTEGEPYATPADPEVCHLYLQNLNYFTKRNLPLSCGQPVSPALANKIKPMEWENLDPKKYPELFKAVARKVFPPGPQDKEPYPSDAMLAAWRTSVSKGTILFRRAKLELKGSIVMPPQWQPKPLSFQIIQFGLNVTDEHAYALGDTWRCHTHLSRSMPDSHQYTLRFLIASDDLNKLYTDLTDLQLVGFSDSSYTNLWTINGRPYGELYDSKGNVLLSEISLEPIASFERNCLFHYKKFN